MTLPKKTAFNLTQTTNCPSSRPLHWTQSNLVTHPFKLLRKLPKCNNPSALISTWYNSSWRKRRSCMHSRYGRHSNKIIFASSARNSTEACERFWWGYIHPPEPKFNTMHEKNLEVAKKQPLSFKSIRGVKICLVHLWDRTAFVALEHPPTPDALVPLEIGPVETRLLFLLETYSTIYTKMEMPI